MLNPTKSHPPSSRLSSGLSGGSLQPPNSDPGVVASPAKVLYNVMRRKISGCLSIRSSREAEAAWLVYAGDGKLNFVSSTAGERERLEYILQRTRSNLLGNLATGFHASAYQFLFDGWQSEQIAVNQLRTLIRLFSQEALVHILAMPQAVIHFDPKARLSPALVSLSLKELVPPIASQIGLWKTFKPGLNSPLQPLRLANPSGFEGDWLPALRRLNPSNGTLSVHLLDDTPCLYQLASRLNLDILQLAQLVSQGMDHRWIGSLDSHATGSSAPQSTLVCIDDSVTVQRNVKLILEAAGHRVIGLTNPLQALSSLAREKPALILMDISMPNLDGYELCRLLRQSALLKDIPIVMLTGRDGFIDKVRAKVAGSTDYITKPFSAETLLETIAKHLATSVQSEAITQ